MGGALFLIVFSGPEEIPSQSNFSMGNYRTKFTVFILKCFLNLAKDEMILQKSEIDCLDVSQSNCPYTAAQQGNTVCGSSNRN